MTNLSRYTKYWDAKKLSLVPFNDVKNRQTLALIDPREFIKLARPTYEDEGVSRPIREKMKGVKSAEGKWESLPFLQIETHGQYRESGVCKVYGHEGRHRAFHMIDCHETLMPVVLWAGTLRWGEDSWRPQFLQAEVGSYKSPCPPSIVWDNTVKTGDPNSHILVMASVINRLKVVELALNGAHDTKVGDSTVNTKTEGFMFWCQAFMKQKGYVCVKTNSEAQYNWKFAKGDRTITVNGWHGNDLKIGKARSLMAVYDSESGDTKTPVIRVQKGRETVANFLEVLVKAKAWLMSNA